THILMISWNTAATAGGFSTNDRNYDRYSESIYILDNTFSGGGTDPESGIDSLIGSITGHPFPQILYDGDVDRRKLVDGVLPEELRTCIQEPEATFWNVDLSHVGAFASPDKAPFDCTHERLQPVVIPGAGGNPTPTPQPTTPGATATPAAGAETRCQVGGGSGVNFDPNDNPCELLSSYRFFNAPAAAQQPNDGVVPYDLNTQLFSDYTVKRRFVYMPPGTSAIYDEDNSFDFPVGTALIKTFAYPHDLRQPQAGDELIETRLLVRREHGWVALPYLWNENKTEARLRVIGATVPVSGIQLDGELRTVSYSVPNANQCKGCHNEHGDITAPLGPKARHLNKDYDYNGTVENQLTHWSYRGILSGAPSPDSAPKIVPFDDPSAGTLEARARGYLDVNCGGCHNPSGPARTSGLFLTIDETDPTHLGICKSPVAAGRGTGGFHSDIVPGSPDTSILTFRMRSTEPGIAMPELGRRAVHAEGVQVVSDWIASLEGSCDVPN
ncbi:MAG TPA: SO2930 family diheme c-type cytochrome, partial [Terriglobales bacterium]|nr:SO2930 family diheme c-type cytochrome [Terriglobales bacterium]